MDQRDVLQRQKSIDIQAKSMLARTKLNLSTVKTADSYYEKYFMSSPTIQNINSS